MSSKNQIRRELKTVRLLCDQIEEVLGNPMLSDNESLVAAFGLHVVKQELYAVEEHLAEIAGNNGREKHTR